MNQTISAVYENGILKPQEPLMLADGVAVEIIVITPDAKNQRRTPAELLAKIAALPSESGDEKFSGREHDRVLYGEGKSK